MPLPNKGNRTCFTRANVNAALNKTKPEDEAKKLPESTVKDPISAINFLMDKEFKCEEDKLTLELLSTIERQLSQQLISTRLATKAFKAISYLILKLHQKHIVVSITDNIAKAISTATKRV